jgi:hypothetical protein
MKSIIQFLTEETLSIHDRYFDKGGEFYQKYLHDFMNNAAARYMYDINNLPDTYCWRLESDYEKYVNDNFSDEEAAELLDFSVGDYGEDGRDEFTDFVDRWIRDNRKQLIKDECTAGYAVDVFRRLTGTVGGNVEIWRAMKVPDNYTEHLKTQGNRLGIYWTYDKSSPDTYWERSGGIDKYGNLHTIIIHSRIRDEYIDWRSTLIANGHPITGEENEITLVKGTPLNIIDIADEQGNAIELSDEIKNKTYYA